MYYSLSLRFFQFCFIYFLNYVTIFVYLESILHFLYKSKVKYKTDFKAKINYSIGIKIRIFIMCISDKIKIDQSNHRRINFSISCDIECHSLSEIVRL